MIQKNIAFPSIDTWNGQKEEVRIAKNVQIKEKLDIDTETGHKYSSGHVYYN